MKVLRRSRREAGRCHTALMPGVVGGVLFWYFLLLTCCSVTAFIPVLSSAVTRKSSPLQSSLVRRHSHGKKKRRRRLSALLLASVVEDEDDEIIPSPSDEKDDLLLQDDFDADALLFGDSAVVLASEGGNDAAEDQDCANPFAPSSTVSGNTIKSIFLVSDGTGYTLKTALQKVLTQFDSCDDDRYYYKDSSSSSLNTCDVQSRTFSFIRSTSTLKKILQTAEEKQAYVVYTFSDPEMRSLVQGTAKVGAIAGAVDLLGPTMDGIAQHLGKEPILGGRRPSVTENQSQQQEQEEKPAALNSKDSGNKHSHLALTDQYFRRIEAVEFTLKADDGQSPWLLPEADVVIVGVSRSGKTPLSVILSQQVGLRVANLPLVRECPLPKQLFATTGGDEDSQDSGPTKLIDPRRVFCLTIAPSELRKIRTTRLERRNVRDIESKRGLVDRGKDEYYEDDDKAAKSDYADRAYIMKDLMFARELSNREGWQQVDVTGRAVEETASLILEYMNERFEYSLYKSWQY